MPKEIANNNATASTGGSSGVSVKKGRSRKVPITVEIPEAPSSTILKENSEQVSSASSATSGDAIEVHQEEIPTFASEIASTLEQLTSIREAAAVAIATLKKLEKRHVKEVKNARKRQKRSTPTNGEARPNCIFKRPIPLNENLARLLNKMPGHTMCPTEITHLVNVYIDEHNLKNGQKKIVLDKMLATCINDSEGSAISYQDPQRGLFRIIKEIIDNLVA